jgi:hypothetical protein
MKKLIISAGMSIVVAGAVAGCASSPTASSGSAQSTPASAASAPASPSTGAQLSSSGPSMPADSMPAEPAQSTPAATSPAPATTSAAGTAPPVTPTAVPAVGAHAVATVGAAVVTCPDPAVADGSESGATHLLAAGVLIDAVVRCETVTRTYPGAGTFTVQLAEVADTGLADFLTELRHPSDPRRTNVVCPMFRIAMPWFALIDNHGAVLRVALPTTQCGQARATALAALNALPFREVAAVRIARVPPPA